MAKHNQQKRRGIKMVVISLSVFIGLLFLAYISLSLIYPAILRSSHKIEESGIDLMETVEIGGIKQSLYFRGENTENPVILYIHGGPGTPVKPFLHEFQYAWEKDFTVVHWDQRNAGKTFCLNDPNTVLETMSFERVLEDAHEVTQYIKQRLNKEHIVILGHSWGSVLGTALVQKYPQDYSAYIGVGQCVNMRDNDRVKYGALLEAVYAKGNKKDISAIEAIAPYPPTEDYYNSDKEKTVMQYLVKYNLASGGIKSIISVMTSPYCDAKEKEYMSKDTTPYQEPLLRYLYNEYDIRSFGTDYEVPVFYIMGENDYETPYPLAKQFFEEITAPHKAFFSIPDAGHMTMMDNKTEFNRVLLNEIKPLIGT